MTTMTQLRKAALSLPEVEEGTHFGMVAFKVRGKGFASVTRDGQVQLSLSEDVLEQVLSSYPMAEPIERSGKPIGVRFPLTALNGKDLNSLVAKSWMTRAPKKLATAARVASRGESFAGAAGLPKNLGKPATRALLLAGVRTLEDVARRSERELLAMHGVGPKAIRLLSEALAERGMTFEEG